MKKVLVLFLMILTISGYGQKDSCTYKDNLSINFTELITPDVRLSYEYFLSPHHSLNIDLGRKYSLSNYSFNPLFHGSDGLSTFVYNDYNISLGYSFYFHNWRWELCEKQHYLSLNFIYIHKYCNNILDQGGSDGNYTYDLVSATQNRYELKLLFGQKIRNKNNSSPVFFSEWYTGIGVYKLMQEEKYFASASGSDPSPDRSKIIFNYYTSPTTSKLTAIEPHFCFGIKFGIAWNNKK
jgi:hypothetical protein